MLNIGSVGVVVLAPLEQLAEIFLGEVTACTLEEAETEANGDDAASLEVAAVVWGAAAPALDGIFLEGDESTIS